MPIDIDKLLTRKGMYFNIISQTFFTFPAFTTYQFFISLGGNPDEIRASQRARFADEGIVDEVIELAEKLRTGKCWRVGYKS